jgi:Phosphoesterase family
LGHGNADLHKVNHVIIVMQENHSFDNYFGALALAAGSPYHQPNRHGGLNRDDRTAGCPKDDHSCVDAVRVRQLCVACESGVSALMLCFAVSSTKIPRSTPRNTPSEKNAGGNKQEECWNATTTPLDGGVGTRLGAELRFGFSGSSWGGSGWLQFKRLVPHLKSTQTSHGRSKDQVATAAAPMLYKAIFTSAIDASRPNYN